MSNLLKSAALVLTIATAAGCHSVAPTFGEEAVLIRQPWLFGHGGVVDDAVMRVVDVQLSIPYIMLAMSIVALVGTSLRNVILVLLLYGWVIYARLVRGQTLSLREHEFVLASRTVGASDARATRRGGRRRRENTARATDAPAAPRPPCRATDCAPAPPPRGSARRPGRTTGPPAAAPRPRGRAPRRRAPGARAGSPRRSPSARRAGTCGTPCRAPGDGSARPSSAPTARGSRRAAGATRGPNACGG